MKSPNTGASSTLSLTISATCHAFFGHATFLVHFKALWCHFCNLLIGEIVKPFIKVPINSATNDHTIANGRVLSASFCPLSPQELLCTCANSASQNLTSKFDTSMPGPASVKSAQLGLTGGSFCSTMFSKTKLTFGRTYFVVFTKAFFDISLGQNCNCGCCKIFLFFNQFISFHFLEFKTVMTVNGPLQF